MPLSIPAGLLDRYLAGECSPEEMVRVEGWIRAHELEDVVTALRAGGEGQRVSHETGRQAIDWAAVQRRIGAAPRVAPLVESRQVRFERAARPRSITAIASLGVAAIAGIALIGALRHWGPSQTHTLDVRTYATAPRQQGILSLPDGSRAQLAPGTTLRVTAQSPQSGLDVHVVGQALFTVAHDPDKPFRVQINNAVAQVLGTTFLVRHYATDRLTKVVVIDGRVALSSAQGHGLQNGLQVLAVHTLGTVDDSGQVRVTPNIAVDDYLAWTTGRLVFHDTPAREAAAELGHAYGVDIRILDSTLAVQPFNWTITLKERSLAEALETFSVALGAHSVYSGRVITLVPGRSLSHRPIRSHPLSSGEPLYGR